MALVGRSTRGLLERDWIEQAQRGDKLAFARIVREHQDAVFRYARYFVGDPELARELAQETFYRFYRTLERFDPTMPVKPWVLRIAANACKDHLKRKRIEARLIHQGGPPPDDLMSGSDSERPDHTAQRTQELARLQSAVLELREEYREPLLMKCVEGLSYEEMQEITGLPVTTLKIRVVRAREQLRSVLEREPVEAKRAAARRRSANGA
jgi:RNA polymerase sigma-70 factor (ECF subfamily)